MTSSTHLRPLVYINSHPIDLSALATYSQSPEDLIAAFEKDSLHKQASYKQQLCAFISDLRAQVCRMRALGSDALQIHSAITQAISQYDLSLSTLYLHNAEFDSNKHAVVAQNVATLQQIRGARVDFTSLSPKKAQGPTVKEVLHRPSSSTAEPRSFRANLSRSLANMDMREHLIDVGITANLTRATGEAVVEAAKTVCSVTDTTKQACKSTLNFVGRAGKATLEVTGQKERVKQAILYLQTCEGSNLAEVLVDRYGFSPEEAKVIAKQYVKDVGALATGVAGYGATSLALTAVKPLVKQVIKGAKLLPGRATVVFSGQYRKTVLSGPSSGFQAFVQAENNIRQMLLQPYRNFKINANRHPKITYSEVPRHPDVYFHATSLDRAFGILKSSSIKRFDKSYYLGSFVSTRPEFLMGDIVFAFNRSIERVSEVLNAYFEGGRHWAGFSKAIPVTSESLEYIAVKADLLAQQPIEALAKQLSAAAGREIPVVPLEPIIEMVEKRALQKGVFVPNEWPLFMKVHQK